MKKILLTCVLAGGMFAGAFAQQDKPTRGKGPDRSPEKRAELRTNHMKESLALTDEQYQKVLAINLEQEKKRQEFRKKEKERIKEQREKMRTDHDAAIKSYEGVLSKEQMTKYNEEAKKRREDMRHNWKTRKG